jgi:hypothetical protein
MSIKVKFIIKKSIQRKMIWNIMIIRTLISISNNLLMIIRITIITIISMPQKKMIKII